MGTNDAEAGSERAAEALPEAPTDSPPGADPGGQRSWAWSRSWSWSWSLAPAPAPLLVLALVLLALAWFTAAGPGSWADASRLATIQSLGERGTLAIDHSDYFWQGDRLRFAGRYYSHQPPMLALLGAPLYAALHHGFGLGIGDPLTYRLLTWWLVGLPVLLGLIALAGLLARRGLSPTWTALVLFAAFFATLLWPYAVVLNQHGAAAGWCLVAFGLLDRRRLVAAGVLFGLAATIDLTAVFALGAALWPAWRLGSFAGAAKLGLGAAGPVGVHLAINRAVAGDFVPFGMHAEAFVYPLSPWVLAGLTGVAREDLPGEQAFYAYHALIGDSGLFSHHPWLAAALLAALWLVLARASAAGAAGPQGGREYRLGDRDLCLAVLAASVGIAGYYLVSSRNFGGSSFGMRWFAVFAPLLALPAGLWVLRREQTLGRTWKPPAWVSVLLGLALCWSTAAAALGAQNPWMKFHYNHARSPLGRTLLPGESPPTRLDHWRAEWRRLDLREPFTREQYDWNYQRLLDQHRRFYLRPTPWLDRAQREAWLRRGLAGLDAVLAPLEAEDEPADARAVAHFWRGKFLVELGEEEEARRAYERALALRPRYQPARAALEALERGAR